MWTVQAAFTRCAPRGVLPIARRASLSFAISSFIEAYAQQFIYALTFNSKTEYMPLPVGLFAYFGRQEVVWNEFDGGKLRRHRASNDRDFPDATISSSAG